MEVFLAEEKRRQAREELGEWKWEDIKEEREGSRAELTETNVQTDETGEQRDRIVKLVKDFPTDDGRRIITNAT